MTKIGKKPVETWYRVTYMWSVRVTQVQVERHTDSNVWIGGRRRHRYTNEEWYCPTWEEARDSIRERAAKETEKITQDIAQMLERTKKNADMVDQINRWKNMNRHCVQFGFWGEKLEVKFEDEEAT